MSEADIAGKFRNFGTPYRARFHGSIIMKPQMAISLRFFIPFFVTLIVGACSCAYQHVDSMLDAIASNSLGALTSILQSGSSPNCSNFDGYTPLGAAVKNRNVSAIKILLSYKADVNLTDGGVSPLYNAALFNCVECANILLSHGGKFIAIDNDIKYLEKYDYVTSSPFWKSIIKQGQAE